MDSDDDFSMRDDASDFGDDENQTLGRAQAAKSSVTGNGDKPVVLGASTNNKQKNTIEEIYQKKSQIEHILSRPDTYSKFEIMQSRHGQTVPKTRAYVTYTYF